MVEDHSHHFFPGLHHFHPNFHLRLAGVEIPMETQQLMEGQAMYLLGNQMEDRQTKQIPKEKKNTRRLKNELKHYAFQLKYIDTKTIPNLVMIYKSFRQGFICLQVNRSYLVKQKSNHAKKLMGTIPKIF